MKYLLLIFITLSLLVTSCAKSSRDIAIIDAKDEIASEDYSDALVYLTLANRIDTRKESTEEIREEKAEYFFLRAHALYGLLRFDEADAIIDQISKTYPETSIAPQARALKKKWHRIAGRD